MTNPATIPKRVYKDAEVIYWPHWKGYVGGAFTPIFNPANGVFPKPIVEPLSIGIIHVKFWGSLSDAAYAEQLNASNSDAWKGFQPGQCWISRIIDGGSEETNGYTTQDLHYVVRCNKYGWDTNIPWLGYFYDDAGDKIAFTTSDGFPYVGMLDLAGGESTTPVISNIIIKNRVNFTSILGA